MKKIFKPAIVLLGNLKYSYKFLLIFVIFIIPLVFVLTSSINNLNIDVNTVKHQRIGVEISQRISALIKFLPQHRGMSATYLGGRKDVKGNIDSIGEDVNKSMDELEVVMKKYEKEDKFQEAWTPIRSKWLKLKEENLNLTQSESFKQHTTLITDVIKFNIKVATTTKLHPVSKVEDYYLIDCLIDKYPQAIEDMGQARGKGSGILAKKSMNENEYTALRYCHNQYLNPYRMLQKN